MINNVTIFNPETEERIDIPFEFDNLDKIMQQIETLPKDEKGKHKIGNVNIWCWGGGAIKK